MERTADSSAVLFAVNNEKVLTNAGEGAMIKLKLVVANFIF